MNVTTGCIYYTNPGHFSRTCITMCKVNHPLWPCERIPGVTSVPHKVNNWVRVWRPPSLCQSLKITSEINNLRHGWLADYFHDFCHGGCGDHTHQLRLLSSLNWPSHIINSVTQETWAANWLDKQANQLAHLTGSKLGHPGFRIKAQGSM